MCKDETRKRQSRLVFVGDVIQISTHFNFVKLNIFFLTHADIYSESDSDSESEFDKDDSEDDEEPCPSRGKPVVSAAQRKQSSKKKPRSASGKKLLQDSEFTSILKTASLPLLQMWENYVNNYLPVWKRWEQSYFKWERSS